MVLTATNMQVVAWDHDDACFLKILRGVCARKRIIISLFKKHTLQYIQSTQIM